MAVIQTVVNNDLLALKVGVTERRCNIDDRTRLVALGLLCAYKPCRCASANAKNAHCFGHTSMEP